jgi:hypothetical protein
MNAVSRKYLVVLLIFILPVFCISASNASTECVTIAILAKDKAHTLPLYLECIEKQTWPASNTYLYIRTNNNTDATAQILKDWVARVGQNYANIYFDDTDVDEPVEQFGQHEWNYTRFKVLGKIRQDSVDWAREHNSHYFVVDCDNFIYPDTLKKMMDTNVPIIAPFLRCHEYEKRYYSNYHDAIDCNGYYMPSVFYYDILDQKVRGIIEVSVVHCTYFIRHEVLDTVCYDDESARYEYVIFSDSARRQNVPQYIDNRHIYGYISFAENREDFERESYDTFFKE